MSRIVSPQAVILLLLDFVELKHNVISASTELCGSETEIELTKTGETSSMTVTLSPMDHNSVCKLRVIAPKTHVINLQFVETSTEIHRALIFNNSEEHPPCMMSIFLHENPRTPVWKGDPCSSNSLAEVDLLTSDFRIVWSPPSNPSHTKGRKFVLTAVGQGQVCKEPGQYTCMRIGWEPLLCISDHLLCDGINNCPKTSSISDEDDKLCKTHFMAQSSWEQLAVEIFKKLKPPSELVNNNKWLQEKIRQHAASSPAPKRSFLNWREWQELKETETTTIKLVTEQKAKMSDSISQVLSKYGPWGYLMLGMLICGTVLMFCGLWECCFRKPKRPLEVPSQTQPTTVLIINNQQEEVSTPSPPNYEDLDQPPSYTMLFPNSKQSTSSSVIEIHRSAQTQNSQNSASQNQSGSADVIIPIHIHEQDLEAT